MKLNQIPKRAAHAAIVLVASSLAQVPLAHADAPKLFIASVLQPAKPMHAHTFRSGPEPISDAASQFIQCCLIGGSPQPGLVLPEAGAGSDGMKASDRFVRDVLIR